jgi:hypothetical protein
VTAEETSTTLQQNELVGFNLAMAREDLRCAMASGTDLARSGQVFMAYSEALESAFFGPEPLVAVETSEAAARVVYMQLGCIAGKNCFELEEVTEHIQKYESETLPEAMKYTIKDLIGPLLAIA